MQTVHSLLLKDRLPKYAVTVRFEFTGSPKIYWLVIDGPQPELCYYDPGRESDLVIRLDERIFGNVVLGRMAFDEAVDGGAIDLDGPPELVRAFPTWLGVTRFAKYALDRRSSTPTSGPSVTLPVLVQP
jgi:hypothetical protein